MVLHKRNALAMLLGLSCCCAFADAFVTSTTVNSAITAPTPASSQDQTLTATQLQAEANRWGLSVSDYGRYIQLMQTTPSGKWYVNSDPAEVLAINARNAAEQKKYAEIVAKNTHDRLGRELSMQYAYSQAWEKLYPNEKPIALPGQTQTQNTVALQAGDQLLFFTRIDDAQSGAMATQLVNAMASHTNVRLAIFVVGKNVTDNAIAQWAQSNQIPPSLVQNHRVVLDHDNGRFAQMTKGNGSLPMIILNHQNAFNVVSFNELKG